MEDSVFFKERVNIENVALSTQLLLAAILELDARGMPSTPRVPAP